MRQTALNLTLALVGALLLRPSLGLSAGRPEMIPLEDYHNSDLIGQPAPSQVLKTLDGGTFDLASQKGTMVLVNFWASWCGPCRREMPALESLYKELRESGAKVAFVGVNVDTESAKARAWLRGHTVSFPIALDPEGTLMGAFGVSSMPTTFVIDARGKVIQRNIGFREEDIPKLRTLFKDGA